MKYKGYQPFHTRYTQSNFPRLYTINNAQLSGPIQALRHAGVDHVLVNKCHALRCALLARTSSPQSKALANPRQGSQVDFSLPEAYPQAHL